jgi:hypothetical protein
MIMLLDGLINEVITGHHLPWALSQNSDTRADKVKRITETFTQLHEFALGCTNDVQSAYECNRAIGVVCTEADLTLDLALEEPMLMTVCWLQLFEVFYQQLRFFPPGQETDAIIRYHAARRLVPAIVIPDDVSTPENNSSGPETPFANTQPSALTNLEQLVDRTKNQLQETSKLSQHAGMQSAVATVSAIILQPTNANASSSSSSASVRSNSTHDSGSLRERLQARIKLGYDALDQVHTIRSLSDLPSAALTCSSSAKSLVYDAARFRRHLADGYKMLEDCECFTRATSASIMATSSTFVPRTVVGNNCVLAALEDTDEMEAVDVQPSAQYIARRIVESRRSFSVDQSRRSSSEVASSPPFAPVTPTAVSCASTGSLEFQLAQLARLIAEAKLLDTKVSSDLSRASSQTSLEKSTISPLEMLEDADDIMASPPSASTATDNGASSDVPKTVIVAAAETADHASVASPAQTDLLNQLRGRIRAGWEMEASAAILTRSLCLQAGGRDSTHARLGHMNYAPLHTRNDAVISVPDSDCTPKRRNQNTTATVDDVGSVVRPLLSPESFMSDSSDFSEETVHQRVVRLAYQLQQEMKVAGVTDDNSLEIVRIIGEGLPIGCSVSFHRHNSRLVINHRASLPAATETPSMQEEVFPMMRSETSEYFSACSEEPVDYYSADEGGD